MIPTGSIADLKRIAVPGLFIASAVALAMFFIMRPSAPGGGHDARTQQTPPPDRLASVSVVILTNGKELPLEIKVGNKYIKIPGPSSWPRGADNDAAGSEQNRFLAGIVDTADVLLANGFKADDAYSFVVGGTELNAANTFRVQGNRQGAAGGDAANGYVDAYRTPAGETGVWRSLKFKNLVLSYGQVPSLADLLLAPAPPTGGVKTAAAPERDNASTGAASGPHTEPSADTRKNIENLDAADPAVRADAIRNLVSSGYQQDRDATVPDMRAALEKSLADGDPAVRAAALNSLNGWSGSISMQALSRVALNDGIPELRMQALDLLVDRYTEQALPTLQQASVDPDLRVARKADQLMAQFSR